ncbi:hypothetical protein [Streptomyces sp. NPDC060198]|uniref:hypothetical protein n=1 Tax=Streptomyces sp. NPDC060198 TaxID=3347070 RepID=UPI00364928FB
MTMSTAVRVFTAADVDPARWPLVALRPLEAGAGSPSWVRRLAATSDAWQRESPAALPDLPDDVTGTLAGDPGVRVVAELAFWPRSRRSRRCAPRPCGGCSARWAGRSGAPPASLVACPADPRARIEAVRHPSLPRSVIVGLLDHPDHATARSAAAGPALPDGETVRLLPPPGRPGLRDTT